MALRFYFIILFLINSQHVKSQLKIYKENDISFDSLLVLKGNQSKGKIFPMFKSANKLYAIDNSIFKNKVTYINFWFKNCPPCIAEMKALNELYRKVQNNSKIQFISFTFENQKTIDEMKIKYKISYPIFSISKYDCYRLNQGNGFPTSLVVDQRGIIKFLISGYDTNPKKAQKILLNKVYPEIYKLL